MTRANLVPLDAEPAARSRRELVRMLRDERDRPDPRQGQRLERAALASGLGHEASTPGAGDAARAWRTTDRRRRRPTGAGRRGVGAAPRSRRPHPSPSIRRGDLRGLGGERPTDGGDPGERAEVVAAAGELRLPLLEGREQRSGEEDRRVRAGADADEQGEREVLERVAAEEVEASATGSSVMKVVASERGRTSQIETFPITRNDARRISGTFSRMRSKTMIVS